MCHGIRGRLQFGSRQEVPAREGSKPDPERALKLVLIGPSRIISNGRESPAPSGDARAPSRPFAFTAIIPRRTASQASSALGWLLGGGRASGQSAAAYPASCWSRPPLPVGLTVDGPWHSIGAKWLFRITKALCVRAPSDTCARWPRFRSHLPGRVFHVKQQVTCSGSVAIRGTAWSVGRHLVSRVSGLSCL